MGGELQVGRRRPALRALGLPWGDALCWPLRQVGLVVMFISLLSFPQALARGQTDGAWGTLSVLGPSGLLATLSQGPVGRYVSYSTLAAILVTSGAVVAAAGGLLSWWRVRLGRGFLAAGLLLAVVGQLAGVLEAVSRTQVYPETPSTVIAAAVIAAMGTGVLLAMVLLAAGGGATGGAHGPTGTTVALPELGVVFLVFRALQFLQLPSPSLPTSAPTRPSP